MLKDKATKYCRYCGAGLGVPALERLHTATEQECKKINCVVVPQYCPHCGDYLRDDTTHCSCDKQD